MSEFLELSGTVGVSSVLLINAFFFFGFQKFIIIISSINCYQFADTWPVLQYEEAKAHN